MKRFKNESGQAVIVVALCMTVLLGFMALAMDVGLLFKAKRNMQAAADAAAIAGALDYKYNGSLSSARTAACTAAAANGVPGACTTGQCSGTSSTTICINNPPLTGAHQGLSGFAEAIVVEPAPTFFMKLFNFNSVNVKARAVVGSGINAGCIWALSTSGRDITLTGSGSITAQNCEIYDNSNASNALSLTGSGSVTAKQIGIVGGYSVTGSGSISPNPPTTGIGPAADPLNLTPPTIQTSTSTCSNCSKTNSGNSNLSLTPGTYGDIKNSGSGTITLAPGNYTINGDVINNGSGKVILGAGNYVITGDLQNTGSASLTLGAGNYSIGGDFKTTGSGAVIVGSGMYTIGGDLSLTGSGALTGTSVTFYTLGSNTLTGSGNMNLTAPTSGPYSGVLIYQPSTSAMSITGSGGDKIQGILYAPKAPLTLTGSGSLNVSLDIIVDTIKLTGSGSIVDTNYSVVTNTNSVLSKLTMVE